MNKGTLIMLDEEVLNSSAGFVFYDMDPEDDLGYDTIQKYNLKKHIFEVVIDLGEYMEIKAPGEKYTISIEKIFAIVVK